MTSRGWPWQIVEDRLLDRRLVREGRNDQPVVVEPEMFGDLLGKLGLSISRKPGELAFVTNISKAAGFGRVTIRPGEAVAQRPALEQPAVIAEMAVEPAIAQRAHAVADIVADAVGRIDQRIVPIGVEQRGQRMRLVMVGEMERDAGTKPVLGEEILGAEDRERIGGAGGADSAPSDRAAGSRGRSSGERRNRAPCAAGSADSATEKKARVVAIASTSVRDQPAIRNTSSIASQGTPSPEPLRRVSRSSWTAATRR